MQTYEALPQFEIQRLIQSSYAWRQARRKSIMPIGLER
jgi:hypothetical protein